MKSGFCAIVNWLEWMLLRSFICRSRKGVEKGAEQEEIMKKFKDDIAR
jgi:hypothetical protein